MAKFAFQYGYYRNRVAGILKGNKIGDHEANVTNLHERYNNEGLNDTRNLGDFLDIQSLGAFAECYIFKRLSWQDYEFEARGKERLLWCSEIGT